MKDFLKVFAMTYMLTMVIGLMWYFYKPQYESVEPQVQETPIILHHKAQIWIFPNAKDA